jgi:hypothetical protein
MTLSANACFPSPDLEPNPFGIRVAGVTSLIATGPN